MNELTKPESKRFKICERIISKTSKAFVACGKALSEILESKLYREKFDSFEDYCQKKWGWGRQRAVQLIEASKVVETLPPECKPMVYTERAARSLKTVPETERETVLERAQKNGPVTAASLTLAAAEIEQEKGSKALQEVKEEKREPVKLKDAFGHPVPADIVGEWERAEQIGKELRHHCGEIIQALRKGVNGDHRDIIFSELSNQDISVAEGLRFSVTLVVPHSICPKCQGTERRKKCATCKHRGWLSKTLFQSPIMTEGDRKAWEGNKN